MNIFDRIIDGNTLRKLREGIRKFFEVSIRIETDNRDFEDWNIDDYIKDIIEDKKELKVLNISARETFNESKINEAKMTPFLDRYGLKWADIDLLSWPEKDELEGYLEDNDEEDLKKMASLMKSRRESRKKATNESLSDTIWDFLKTRPHGTRYNEIIDRVSKSYSPLGEAEHKKALDNLEPEIKSMLNKSIYIKDGRYFVVESKVNEEVTVTLPFITDFGEEIKAKDAETGKLVYKLPRYSYWADKGRGKPEIVETSNDLKHLIDSYKVPMENVILLKMVESKVNEEVDDLLEKVSALVHEEWMAWAKDILKTEKISEERSKRWETECFKPYEELSEEMKEYDREWARKFIKLLQPSVVESKINEETNKKDHYQLRDCWSFKDITTSLNVAHEECKGCSSKECRRRIPHTND